MQVRVALLRFFHSPRSIFTTVGRTARSTLNKKNDALLWLDCTGEVERDLVPHGYLVFRAVRAGGCSVDRAAVGPNGVFLLESVGRGKRVATRIVYDRENRAWPFYVEQRDVERARAHALRLSGWLAGILGEAVGVYPLLVLPGWLGNRGRWGDIVLVGAGDYDVLTRRQARCSGALIRETGRILAERSAPSEAATAGEWSDDTGDAPFAAEKGTLLEIACTRTRRPFLAYTSSACLP